MTFDSRGNDPHKYQATRRNRLTIAVLETQLREQSVVARKTPAAHLRRRTLGALQSAPMRAASQAHLVHRRLGAAAALCSIAALAALVASVVPLTHHRPPTQIATSGSRPAATWTLAAVDPATWNSDALRVPPRASLLNEARLLARNAEHTVNVFRTSLPQRPRLESSSRTQPAINHR